MSVLDGFCSRFVSGDSWILIVSILIVSCILCAFLCLKPSIFTDWAYEPILEIPKQVQRTTFVLDWFNLTRGVHYSAKPKGDLLETVKNMKRAPTQTEHKTVRALFSGFGFSHFLQHFLFAFLCPKLIHVSFIFGISWEIVETLVHAHCALDIFWNTCGCLLGLLVRLLVFPNTFVESCRS